jgi:hypothetical protein
MTRTVKIFAITLISLAALIAAGCPARRTIADLERNPGKYNGKDVTVAGVVRSSYGGSIPGTGIGGGIYEIDDGTGTIWVVAQGGVPNKGAEIAVSGMYGNVATWGGKNYGTGIQETERHYRKR